MMNIVLNIDIHLEQYSRMDVIVLIVFIVLVVVVVVIVKLDL